MTEEVNKVKVLPDNLPIWVMCSEAGSSKQRIENTLNRRTSLINDMSSLIKYAGEQATVEGQKRVAKASLIVITNDLPDLLKAGLSKVVAYIDALQYVTVFEVNVKPKDVQLFKSTYRRFGSLDDFLEFALTEVRDQAIDVMDPNDRQTQILKSMRADNAGLKARLETYEEQINGHKEELATLEGKIATLEDREENEYIPELKKYKEYASDLEDKVSRMDKDLTIAKNKASQYLKEKDEIFGEKEEYSNKSLGLEGMLDDKEKEIRELKEDIEQLKKQIEDERRKQQAIIESRVDSETMVLVQNDLKKTQEELEAQKSLASRYFADVQKYTVKNERLLKTIDDMQRSTDILSYAGRTNLVSEFELKNTDLVYIKLFNELPFHRKAVLELFKLIVEQRGYRNGKLVILKNDEQFDSNIFYDVNLVGTMGDIRSTDEIVRVLPSTYISTGIDEFEDKTDFVLFLDYLQTSKYYVKSHAKSFYMTAVQKEAYIGQYGLTGFPIGYEQNSLFDISYSNEIGHNVNEKIRDRMLLLRVEEWYKNMVRNGF